MVKSHWKHRQHMQKLYCGRGLSLQVCFTSETDIWVQIGRGKVGLSGNIQVKSYIPKSKFDNVFDIMKTMCYMVQYSTVLEHLGIIYTQTHYHKWPRIFEICDHTQQTHFPCKHYHK